MPDVSDGSKPCITHSHSVYTSPLRLLKLHFYITEEVLRLTQQQASQRRAVSSRAHLCILGAQHKT